jgi:hypothetical protein
VRKESNRRGKHTCTKGANHADKLLTHGKGGKDRKGEVKIEVRVCKSGDTTPPSAKGTPQAQGQVNIMPYYYPFYYNPIVHSMHYN